MNNSICTFFPIESTTVVLPTSVPNVYATMKAYPLAKRFCSCPTAAQLLDSERFIKPLLIDTQDIIGAAAQAHTYWKSNHAPISAKILIAEENLQTTKSLSHLAFEIFNTQRTSKDLYRQATLGNVGMDSYARQLEEHEIADTQEHYELIKQCGIHWSMPPEEQEKYTQGELTDQEVTLFMAEYSCHTDGIRQIWVEKCQKIYCEKHPADNRSCNTKMTDLCNDNMVRRMSNSERGMFLIKRICELFPQAHVTVKNDPDVRGIIRENCPELLEKPSQQLKQEEL